MWYWVADVVLIYYLFFPSDNYWVMIYSIEGEFVFKRDQFAVIKVGGIGFKVFLTTETLKNLPATGNRVALFTHFYLREDAANLYGFLTEKELRVFEMLIAISGIGPRSALGILGVAPAEKLLAAIKEGRTELLTKVSGIGRKTADRVILELREKIHSVDSERIVGEMESDSDIEDALLNLGYTKEQIRGALKKVDPSLAGLEIRLRAALKLLKK